MLLPRISSFLQVIYLSAACVGGYWLYWELTTGRRRRQLTEKNGCRPAKRVKTRDPILGLDAVFEMWRWSDQHTLLENTAQMFFGSGSKTIEFNFLGYIAILSSEAENLKTVLSHKFRLFRMPTPTKELDLLLQGGIFLNEGEAWHQSRELIRPSFARSQVADLDMLEKQVSTLVDKIPRDGSTIDLSKLFPQLTLSAAINFLFGERSIVGGSAAEMASNDTFTQVWNHVSLYLANRGEGNHRMLWLYNFVLDLIRMNPQHKRDCHTIHNYIDNLVEKSLSAKQPEDVSTSTRNPRYVFVHELVSQTTDKLRIRSEALSVLFAATDTTATLLTNVWFELSKRPDIWARLRDEVDSLHGQKPSYEQLKNLKYLRAVLTESQRLYPITPANGRQALEDTILPLGGGDDGKSPMLVKKGQLVIFDIRAMHRRKDLYGEDAGIFRPERWLDTEEQRGLRMGWDYLPFSGGPRVCPGQNFALTEVSYVTIRLMQSFPRRLESRDPEPWRESITFIVGNLGGCKVGLFPSEDEAGGEEEEEEDDEKGEKGEGREGPTHRNCNV